MLYKSITNNPRKQLKKKKSGYHLNSNLKTIIKQININTLRPF